MATLTVALTLQVGDNLRQHPLETPEQQRSYHCPSRQLQPTALGVLVPALLGARPGLSTEHHLRGGGENPVVHGARRGGARDRAQRARVCAEPADRGGCRALYAAVAALSEQVVRMIFVAQLAQAKSLSSFWLGTWLTYSRLPIWPSSSERRS